MQHQFLVRLGILILDTIPIAISLTLRLGLVESYAFIDELKKL